MSETTERHDLAARKELRNITDDLDAIMGLLRDQKVEEAYLLAHRSKRGVEAWLDDHEISFDEHVSYYTSKHGRDDGILRVGPLHISYHQP